MKRGMKDEWRARYWFIWKAFSLVIYFEELILECSGKINMENINMENDEWNEECGK